jgi:hypothetical protein
MPIDLIDVDRKRWAEAVAVANTPASLAAWLERDPTVQRIAEVATEDDIIDAIYPLLRLEAPRSAVTLAVAYALLVALGMKRRSSTGDLSTPFDLSILPWASQLWERLAKSTVTTGLIQVSQVAGQSIRHTEDAGSGTAIVGVDGLPLALDRRVRY